MRLINLGGANSALLLSRVEADIHAAVNAVVAFWGTDWAREISVVAAGSDEQFRTAAGGGTASQWADIAAVTVAERFDPGSRAVAGQRIVFAPGAVKMSATAMRIVLAHELFHYAARVDTALDAPRWLTEGWPISSRGRPLPDRLRPHPQLCRQTTTSTFPGRRARERMTEHGGLPDLWPTPMARPSCATSTWPPAVQGIRTCREPRSRCSARMLPGCSPAGSNG